MHFRYIPTSFLALLGALALLPQPASAKAVIASSGSLQQQIASLATGDQLVVEGQGGTIDFAGREISLIDATAILGYASEVAYLTVIDGSASLGDLTAGRGKMLVIPPFGSEPGVERFDAGRLADSLSKQRGVNDTAAFASLEGLAQGQRTGLFFGRLVRTSFNLTTLGSAQDELDRRSRVGGAAIREARFAAPAPGTDIEQSIVERFLAALAGGDVAGVAQMLDPLPYGYGNLAGGGSEARLIMARVLVAERDWQGFAAEPPTKSDNTEWVASGSGGKAVINLRRTTDFAFIQSIKVEERP